MIIKYSHKAEGHLAALPKGVSARIMEKIDWFGEQVDPLAFAEPVLTRLGKVYRFRIGDYRALFRLEGGTIHLLLVLAVKHRKEAYRFISV